MSDMTATVDHPGPKAPKVKRRRKYAKRKPVSHGANGGGGGGGKLADHLAGATTAKCPIGCVDGVCCVTSPWLGGQFCGHPLKASHPTAPRDVFLRIDELKKHIAQAK